MYVGVRRGFGILEAHLRQNRTTVTKLLKLEQSDLRHGLNATMVCPRHRRSKLSNSTSVDVFINGLRPGWDASACRSKNFSAGRQRVTDLEVRLSEASLLGVLF